MVGDLQTKRLLLIGVQEGEHSLWLEGGRREDRGRWKDEKKGRWKEGGWKEGGWKGGRESGGVRRREEEGRKGRREDNRGAPDVHSYLNRA